MKEGGTMKEITISIVSMQIGAFIGIETIDNQKCEFTMSKLK